jgi:hypothetical protein
MCVTILLVASLAPPPWETPIAGWLKSLRRAVRQVPEGA